MKSQHLILASIINRLAGKEIAWLLPTRCFHSDSRSKGGQRGIQKLAEGVRQGSIPSREQLPALQNYLCSIFFFLKQHPSQKLIGSTWKDQQLRDTALILDQVQPLQMKIALALYAMICLHLLWFPISSPFPRVSNKAYLFLAPHKPDIMLILCKKIQFQLNSIPGECAHIHGISLTIVWKEFAMAFHRIVGLEVTSEIFWVQAGVLC